MVPVQADAKGRDWPLFSRGLVETWAKHGNKPLIDRGLVETLIKHGMFDQLGAAMNKRPEFKSLSPKIDWFIIDELSNATKDVKMNPRTKPAGITRRQKLLLLS